MKRVLITTNLILVMTSIILPQVFFDDFESYNVGEQLVVQNPVDWTTWSNAPGSDEDPYIQNLGSNVVNITVTNDLVYEIPNLITGEYDIQFEIYIPDSSDAYFNTLQEYTPSPSWGMQAFFGYTNYGEGYIDGGVPQVIFTFYYDTWMTVRVTVDLDNDWAEFYLDEVLIHSWIWSTGSFGTNNLNQLGGSNFYAWSYGYFANPDFYIDNYSVNFDGAIFFPPENVGAIAVGVDDVHITWLPPIIGEPIGYKIWRNNDSLDYVEPTTLEYYEFDIELGYYEYCISAVYDEGESEGSCADPLMLSIPPPTNLYGPYYTIPGDPVNLTWEYPINSQWIRWDAGVNTGNGIGLTNGGTFGCASHWYPNDLVLLNGLQLQEIEFYANGDPNASYIVKVWTGANGTNEVHCQEVISFNVDDWNNVVLTAPATINSATDLWFGYEVTHEAGTYPAGCDEGPAVAYNGDMITTGGGWLSMSTQFGLDYNWNIAGLVGMADGKVTDPLVKLVKLPDSDNDFGVCGSSGTYNKFVPGSIKEFYNFNVYRKEPGATFFEVIGTTTETEYEDYIDYLGYYEYYVTAVWDPEGESDPSNIWIVDIIVPPGIEDVSIRSTVLFPNPAKETIYIKFLSINKEINPEFELMTLTGNQIKLIKLNNIETQVSVGDLSVGVYLYTIKSGTTILKRGKIVKL
ncbi:MAG: T9SS type A sorting domain-containing protein [Bacteroidales bacterium]|nr:T9SS type A sorting domain-containing protein [Bacteroidales bacterium]